jgi:hypothetical protein
MIHSFILLSFEDRFIQRSPFTFIYLLPTPDARAIPPFLDAIQ